MQQNPETNHADERILILAPFGQDAPLAAGLLAQAGVRATTCADLTELLGELDSGAGALLIAYEALANDAKARLGAVLDGQPAWSDIPVFVFLPASRSAGAQRINGSLDALGNVTL